MAWHMRRPSTRSGPGSIVTGRNGTEDPIAELEHRDAIRDQALGAAYAAHDLDVPARYEVHLDRKLERTLAMLFRLKELRQSATPA